MGGSIRLGSVLGFEIRLDLSWFLVMLLMSWTLATGVFPSVYGFNAAASWVLGTLAALLLFASVLIHELSHAIVARRHGLEVSGITLFLFGGVAQLKDEPATPRAEFQIAGIGPVTSMAIGLACLGLSLSLPIDGALRPTAALLNYLGVVNIALALFNMIPGFPLDGGRLLRSAVWHFTGSLRKATHWAALSGQVFAWIMIAFGVMRVLAGDLGGVWLVFVGWFLNRAAQASYQQLLLRRALSGVSVSDIMTQDVPVIDADIRVPEFVEKFLLQHDHSVYPVARHGEFVGVVTLDDVRSLERDLWGVTCVGALAKEPEVERVLHHDQDAWAALTQMIENDAPRLLVVDDGKLAGIVSREAILRLVQVRSRLGLAR
jgi:Zn-dependent protease